MITKLTKHVCLLFVIALCAGACASASAKGKPADVPGLNVPVPPPRVVDPTPETTSETVPDMPAASSTPPANARPPARPPSPREIPPKPGASEARSEAKPEGRPEAQAEATAPITPAPQLRPTDSTGAGKTARDTLDRARRILSTVDYRPLSKERKKAYDDAKRFADQADAALKQGNVVFAQAVATKAETLAKELAAR